MGQTGTDFIVTKKALKYNVGFEPYNEQICKLRIKDKYNNITLINPLNVELNPICHLLASVGAHHILHVSRVRVNVYAPTK